ncbi:MAG: transpeptidase family protein [Deltaproteobacteria bacterium]|nr:transpeptidase family protein [Deltaproteobacteria bacterium]
MARVIKKNMDKKWLRVRIFTVLTIFLILFVFVTARAFQLQVIHQGKLEAKANSQHLKTINILAERGGVYDRNFSELGITVKADSVYADPSRVGDPVAVAERIASLLSMDRRSVGKKLSARRRFVWLKRQIDLTGEERATLAKIEGIGLLKESRRFYPAPQLGSNLIGFVGLDSTGLEGVELKYNRYLAGGGVKVRGERDALGREMLFDGMEKPHSSRGNDVVLTIDKTVQYIAEKELAKVVAATGSKAGMAIVMDPNTGEVLAMANAPTFDSNHFWNHRPNEWRNRAITDSYEPGSTFKAFLLAAALEEGVVKPNDIFFCENGAYDVADRTFHDVKKHGWLSVANTIKHSSNICAIKLGEQLGERRFLRYIDDMGFGRKSGIDLPGEASGVVRRFKGSNVSLATISFGQGISTTAIQLVNGISTIANGGFLMKPYLTKAIIAPDGVVLKEYNPTVVRRVFSEETMVMARSILKGVTERGGTGVKAALAEIDVAGKTGTAQKPDLIHGGYASGKYVSSFLGFAPADSPRLAVVVLIDEPAGDFYGSTVAAPVFREIVKQSLAYMGVYPKSDEGSIPRLVSLNRRIVRAGVQEGRVPNFRDKSMRMVLRVANEAKLKIKIVGSGRAISQAPLAGSEIDGDGVIEVRFQ